MLHVSAEHFINAGILFSEVTAILREVGDDECIHHESIKPTIVKLHELNWLCRSLELDVTCNQLDDALAKYEAVMNGCPLDPDDPYGRNKKMRMDIADALREIQEFSQTKQDHTEHVKWRHLRDDMVSLRKCFEAELRTRVFMSLSPDESRLHQKFAPMGRNVLECFPGAEYDIREAARCLALGHETAPVLHLMRVLEIGLAAMAVRFGVSFDYRNWENIIGDIEKEIKAISAGKNKPADWKEQEALFADVAKEFRYFKNAWRNHAMHAREKYTLFEAKGIFQHVSGFMEALCGTGIGAPITNVSEDFTREPNT
jgi:hypothetical protein